MRPRVIWAFFTIFAFLCLSCGENKKAPEQNGGQVVSPSISTQDPDINAFIELDESPKFLKSVQAKYPEVALKAGFVGTVYVKALVTQEGRVKRAVVIQRKGGTPELDQAAIEACPAMALHFSKSKGSAHGRVGCNTLQIFNCQVTRSNGPKGRERESVQNIQDSCLNALRGITS